MSEMGATLTLAALRGSWAAAAQALASAASSSLSAAGSARTCCWPCRSQTPPADAPRPLSALDIASHHIASASESHRITLHRIASHRIAPHRAATHRIAKHAPADGKGCSHPAVAHLPIEVGPLAKLPLAPHTSISDERRVVISEGASASMLSQHRACEIHGARSPESQRSFEQQRWRETHEAREASRQHFQHENDASATQQTAEKATRN